MIYSCDILGTWFTILCVFTNDAEGCHGMLIKGVCSR